MSHCPSSFVNRSLATLAALTALASAAFSQSNDGRKNNPYFPSPVTSVKQSEPTVTPSISNTIRQPAPKPASIEPTVEIRPVVARITNVDFKKSAFEAASPVEIYRIGIGDIIFVNLINAPNSSGYYTVKTNGMIDFPLAGDRLVVAGHTTGEIAQMLVTGITLYAKPQVQVNVREYRSHKITVSGMVEQSGETSLQREAVPLFVICAQSGVDPKANRAVVHRADPSNIETFSLHEASSDQILVYPGNLVEFTADPVTKPAAASVYYISGKVTTTGQKELASGMTLSQAIAVSGGAKGNPKKAMISRKSSDGRVNISNYDLRAIRDSKIPDPILAPGDVIEIGN